MARQRLNSKKVEKLAKSTGLNVKHALVRGGTDHRVDLLIAGGSIVHLYKDGEIETSDITWNDPPKPQSPRSPSSTR